jgi:malate dehydrogenase (quinone)
MPAIKKSILSVTALAMFVSTASYANTDTAQKTDFLLIGGGIMSASLAPGCRNYSRTGNR